MEVALQLLRGLPSRPAPIEQLHYREASLRKALVDHSDTVIRNFTENLLSYAIGRRVEYYDQPSIRAIVKKASQNGNRLSSFVLGIVNSAAFQMARAEPALTTVER